MHASGALIEGGHGAVAALDHALQGRTVDPRHQLRRPAHTRESKAGPRVSHATATGRSARARVARSVRSAAAVHAGELGVEAALKRGESGLPSLHHCHRQLP